MEIINLLGLNRDDRKVVHFLNNFDIIPTVTIDNSDGANDEYIEFKKYGFCLYFDQCILVSIFLHSGEVDSDYSKFKLNLPSRLKFEMSKKDIIKLLGIPNSEGGGTDFFWGEIPNWVKYELDSYFLHVEFISELGNIKLITLENKTT